MCRIHRLEYLKCIQGTHFKELLIANSWIQLKWYEKHPYKAMEEPQAVTSQMPNSYNLESQSTIFSTKHHQHKTAGDFLAANNIPLISTSNLLEAALYLRSTPFSGTATQFGKECVVRLQVRTVRKEYKFSNELDKFSVGIRDWPAKPKQHNILWWFAGLALHDNCQERQNISLIEKLVILQSCIIS